MKYIVFIMLLATILFVTTGCSDPTEKARVKLKELNVDYSPQGFIDATEKYDIVVVELFIRSGFYISGEVGENALETAVDNGHNDMVKLLLEANAPATEWELETAVDNGHDEMVKLLLEANAPATEDALETAVDNGHNDMVKLLLEANAPATEWELETAVDNGHDEIVQLLLEANVPATEDALETAVDNGHNDIVKLLLGANAPVTERALYVAVDDGRDEIVEQLLRAGFDTKEGVGQDALNAATLNGHDEIVKLLLDAGVISPIEELLDSMVSVPGGTFRMGEFIGEGGEHEQPVHSVTVPSFRMGKYEVTLAQWDVCVTDGGCGGYRPDNEGWGQEWDRGRRPVINASWDDIQEFINWLNNKTSGKFRLPTEAEWEYTARAGSSTKYHFGDDVSQLCQYGNHADTNTGYDWRNKTCSDGEPERSSVVGRYQPNEYGLYDMHGNVWECVQDCWNNSYAGAPRDGRAWTSGDCDRRVVRGGSWYSTPWYLRSAYRYGRSRSYRASDLGFRLAQDL